MHYAELRAVREELTGPGGQFEITEAEVLGNQLRVFKHAPPSVREVWLASAAFAEQPYLIYGDEVLTYAQSHAQVNAIAAWLFAHGVQPGNRVAIAIRNYPEWMLILGLRLGRGRGGRHERVVERRGNGLRDEGRQPQSAVRRS